MKETLLLTKHMRENPENSHLIDIYEKNNGYSAARKVLKDNNKEYKFHRYDGAGHGFMYYHTPLYRQQQSVDAWEKILDFVSDNLRS